MGNFNYINWSIYSICHYDDNFILLEQAGGVNGINKRTVISKLQRSLRSN